MKLCLACNGRFESDEWTCPNCGYRPAAHKEIFQFAEDPAGAQAGFKPEYFARLAAIEPGHFWFRARNALVQWAVRKYFPNAQSFLEIGCGTGYVLGGIRENFPGMRLVGSDIFTDGLIFAKARLPEVELYQMDARRIFFECEFDVVGAFDVLEHLVEDESALAQMFNAARPGGGLLVTVPQQRYLWSASDRFAMHQRRYSRAELRAKVRKAGFEIQRITSFNSLLLPLMILSRMQQKRHGDSQPWRELEISPALNKTLESVLTVERSMITSGVSFPAGGSLLLIGRKPFTKS
jgi:SAM-dependent methyltransferase